MSCLNNALGGGGCTYFYADQPKDENLGADAEGNCMCEDDEYPTDSCTYFEDADDDYGDEE